MPVLIDSEAGKITSKEAKENAHGRIRAMQWMWAWDAYALAAAGLSQVRCGCVSLPVLHCARWFACQVS